MDNKELQLKNEMVIFLKDYFSVWTEVTSTDNKKRIDIILVHRSDKKREYPIGIEVKVNDKKTGKSLAAWLKQASVYSEKEFKGFGKCMVIAYPQISGNYLREGEKMHNHEKEEGCSHDHNASTFIGQFNVGELQKYRDYVGKEKCRIVFKGQLIWDMQDDILRKANYERILK